METGNKGAMGSVLVVEDDHGVARMLRISLRAAGFDVAQAANGGDALRIPEQRVTDAVVLDLNLPDGLGGAVLDRSRHCEGSDGSSPAWVVTTALDRAEATKLYGPLGRYFVAKPFDPWELVRTLEGMLSPAE